MVYNDTGVMNLQVAIVKQAASDYRKAYRKLLRLKRVGGSDLELRFANDKVNELDRWFRSDYGALLCADMGDVILKRIREEEEIHAEEIHAKGVKKHGAKS